VQLSTLVSIKTGGCPEDCGYCPQAARYHTGVANEPMMALDAVLDAARAAKAAGATRFCMGAPGAARRTATLRRCSTWCAA
jgi:biotin synthase